MIPPLWLENGAAYFLQVTLLAAAGLAAPRFLGLRASRPLHRYLQLLLIACLALPAVQPWRERVVSGSASASILSFTSAVENSPVEMVSGPFWTLARLGAVVFAAGMLVRLAWLALGLLRLADLKRRALRVEPLPAPVLEMAERLQTKAGFFHSHEMDGLVTFGLLRPVILLPRSFFEMAPGLQRAAACHELLHVRRRDWLFAVAEEFVKALFWFHPLIARLVVRIRATREEIVDRAVVESTGAPKTYVEALLQMAGAAPLPCPGASMFAERGNLTRRVSLLLKEVPMPLHRVVVSACLVAAVALLAGVIAVRSFPLETVALAAASRAPEMAAPSDAPVYKVGGGVEPPKLESKVEPQYSPEALARKIQGGVTVVAEIWPDGQAHNLRVEKSLEPSLDARAMDAISTWRFKPGTRDGEPVKVLARIEVNFRLAEGPARSAAPANAGPPKDAPLREAPAPAGSSKKTPRIVTKVEPEYTEEARKACIQGTCVLKIEISPEGYVENPSIVHGLDPGLDENALHAVRQWRFLPATKDGQPVRADATVEINFRLDSCSGQK